MQLSPEIHNSLRRFMASAKSIIESSREYRNSDVAEALNESWDFYAGSVDANATPTKVKNILHDLIQRFPGFSPVVESDGMKEPSGTALTGGDGPKEELEDQPTLDDNEELAGKESLLTREPKNKIGTPIIKGSEKGMSGKNSNGSGSLEESLAASFSGKRPAFKQAGSGQAAGRLHPSPTEEEEEGYAESLDMSHDIGGGHSGRPNKVVRGAPLNTVQPTGGVEPKQTKGQLPPPPRSRMVAGPVKRPQPQMQPQMESCDGDGEGAVCDSGVDYPSKAAAKPFKKAKKDGKMSESIMKANIGKLAGYVRAALAESAKNMRGGKYALSFNVAVLEGDCKNRTPQRKQLSEALADAEEILQLHHADNVALEATFVNGNTVVGHKAIPLFAVDGRAPLMSEGKALFRFRRNAEGFANDLVAEGLVCRVTPHVWGSTVEVQPVMEDVSHVVQAVAESFFNEEKWIQDAFKDVKKRGTEGVCTGDKFGSESCPPGSKRYNMAKNLRKMSKK